MIILDNWELTALYWIQEMLMRFDAVYLHDGALRAVEASEWVAWAQLELVGGAAVVDVMTHGWNEQGQAL